MNFGGFVSLSTIDWRGRAACTVFFRGCPIRCSYCQNEGIITGEDYRDIEEIKEMILSRSMIMYCQGANPTPAIRVKNSPVPIRWLWILDSSSTMTRMY